MVRPYPEVSNGGDVLRGRIFEFSIRDVLFEFHLKFWNTASICIPLRSLKVDRLLTGPTAQQKLTLKLKCQ